VAELHDDVKALRKDIVASRADLQHALGENINFQKCIDILEGDLVENKAMIKELDEAKVTIKGLSRSTGISLRSPSRPMMSSTACRRNWP